MRKPIFTGVCTALVTPFLKEQVNFPLMGLLLKRQLDAGIKAVVISGTTGEAPTLSDVEKKELIRRCRQVAGDECMIIAGTGSNATEHAVILSKEAEEAGADALLVVTPYYNKASETGLYEHYLRIAHSVSIPVIIYNVPGRTGVDIPVSVLKRLSRVPNIVGIKEASQDITKITRIRNSCEKDFYIWTGNDDHAVPAISLGASGVISVASNVCPKEVLCMTQAALNEDSETAARLQHALQPLIDLLFREVNPIPVKYAMQLIGYDCGGYRLPLTRPSQETINQLTAYFVHA